MIVHAEEYAIFTSQGDNLTAYEGAMRVLKLPNMKQTNAMCEAI